MLLALAPALRPLLAGDGVIVPIQNGGVAPPLATVLGAFVLGGLSNLGATMHAPGRYQQRNDGHLLVGELRGGRARAPTPSPAGSARGGHAQQRQLHGRHVVQAGAREMVRSDGSSDSSARRFESSLRISSVPHVGRAWRSRMISTAISDVVRSGLFCERVD